MHQVFLGTGKKLSKTLLNLLEKKLKVGNRKTNSELQGPL